jgi:hypothetical protein
MKKVCIIIMMFLPTMLFANADVRNISLSSGCYVPEQNITVSFQVNVAAAYGCANSLILGHFDRLIA